MSFLKRPFFFIIRFLREVRIEMKRVGWLTKREVLIYTVLVIAASLIIGIYLGAVDFVLTWILKMVVS